VWFSRPSPVFSYGAAVLLAVAAQLARLPLHRQTILPHITYMPFILLGTFFGGLGPGLLITSLCTLESLYFAIEPLYSLSLRDPWRWEGLAAMALTGGMASILFDLLKRARLAESVATERRTELARELDRRNRMLESIIQYSPVPIALLRGPDFVFEMVNPAYEALAPGEPMAGRTVAVVWPEAVPLVLPLLKVVREAQTVYHATGMEVPLHRAPASAAEERYFDFSYVPLAGAGGDADVQVLVVATEVTEYKLTEKSLRAAHQELTTIHANIPLAIFVIDEELRVWKSSDAATRSGALDHPDKLGVCPIQGLGCIDGLADSGTCGYRISCNECPIRLAARDSLRNGVRHEGVEALVPVSVNGIQQFRWLLVSTSPMELEGKKALICVQDITARKHMEDQLEQQRARLQRQAELINFSHDAIITTNPERVIQAWNKGAEEMYGWTEAEAVGRVVHDLLQRRPAEGTDEINRHLYQVGRWDGELSHARRNGERIIVESRQVLLRDAAGAPAGILGINRDITERKRAEEDLRESRASLQIALAETEANHNLLAAALTAQTDAILVFNLAGVLVRMNPAAATLFGTDATGKDLAEIVSRIRVAGGLSSSVSLRALRGETVINAEQTAGEHTLESSSAPMRNAKGEITGAVTVIRDISERRRTELALQTTFHALEAAVREKTVLLKEVHHRVKNNLAVIASMLNMDAGATELPEARSVLQESQQRVFSIALIHEQLYGTDRLDRINFAEYTQQLVSDLNMALGAQARGIAIRVDAEPIEMGVDRAVPCALILNELVTNAFKHAFPNQQMGEVRVSFRASEPGFLELQIEDNGVGCSAGPSWKSGKSVGWRIVSILAKQLGGSLEQELSAGTRFVLRFPAGTSRPAPDRSQAATPDI